MYFLNIEPLNVELRLENPHRNCADSDQHEHTPPSLNKDSFSAHSELRKRTVCAKTQLMAFIRGVYGES